MNNFQADLHIHTVLSPCGDLSMSPLNIVERAASIGLNIIGITDHNSTLHGPIARKLADKHGIMVLFGAEITTKEEVHCVCLFENEEQRVTFQSYIERNLPYVKNNPDIFGHQLVVNEKEEILDEIESLLISGINAGINEVEALVHQLGGLFIPAHIDRLKYSLISQLGFIPRDLKFDALEISKGKRVEDAAKEYSYAKNLRFLKSSDAHSINQMGASNTSLRIESLCWDEIKMAILGLEGREVIVS
jgi:predicted metal-dependent phosphoesterase TrpH